MTSDRSRIFDILPYLILAIAVGLAIFLRFYKLGQVPPALNGDEAAFGSGALQILENGPTLSVEGQGGAGVLASYIVAVFFALSEPGKMALRFQTSFFGVLTILLLFFAARALFAFENRSAELAPHSCFNKSALIGAIAALLLAVSYSHATISRISFAIVHLPFLELLSVWLFWTAYRSGRRLHFILVGASLALVMYGYVAGVVMPAVFVGFLFISWALSWLESQFSKRQACPAKSPTKGSGERSRRDAKNAKDNEKKEDLASFAPSRFKLLSLVNLAAYAAAFVIGVLPLIFAWFGAQDVETSSRVGETSFLSPAINQGDPLGALWRGVSGNYAAFGLQPIQWLLRGDWGEFLVNPLPLMIFIGLVIALTRFKRRPYLFLLLWWGLTIVPAALAPSEIPSPTRAIGAFAPMMIFAALAVVELLHLAARSIAGQRGREGERERGRQGEKRARSLFSRLPSTVYSFLGNVFGRSRGFSRKSRPEPAKASTPTTESKYFSKKLYRLSLWVGVVIPLALLLWLAISIFMSTRQRFDYYFNVWSKTNDALAAFDDYADDLARDMADLAAPRSVFLLPRNTSAGSISPNGSVNFFYRLTNSPAPHLWVPDDEASLPTVLTKAAGQASTFNIARWKVSKHTGADPKEIFRYYLEKYGLLTQVRHFQDYDIETYTLPQVGQDFQAAEILQESNVNFGEQVLLTNYAYGNAGPGDPETDRVKAGDPVWVRLRWQKLADHPEDLKVSLIVKDALGHRLAFVDKHLQNNWLHQRSSQWEPGSVEDTYFILDLPQDAMPGEYQTSIVVYGEISQTPLPVLPSGEREFPLGTLRLLPSVQVPASPTLPAGTPIETQEGTLELYADSIIIPDNPRPGDHITLDAVWRAPIPPHADYTFQLDLRGEACTERSRSKGEVIPLLAAGPIGGEAYPTHRWRAGETLRQHYSATIPPGTSGEFVLTVSILSESSEPTRWGIEPVTVRDWEHRFELPADATPLEARFANGDIRLAGYNLSWTPSTAGAPGQASVTLYWQADAPPEKNYTAFVHLSLRSLKLRTELAEVTGLPNEAGELAAQLDRPPTGGEKPMTGWLPGEIVADTLTLDLPAGVAPESLRVTVGLYDPDTFQRLPASLEGKSVNEVVLH